MASAAFATGVAAQTPPKPASLTMNVYSGPFEDNMREYVVAPFERETGIKVTLVPSSPPLAKLQAEGADPSVDILIAGAVERQIGAQLGVTVDFDPGAIPGLGDIYDVAKFSNGIVLNFSALGLAYDKTQWTSPPTSWFDLVSDKTPGKIVVRQPDAQNTVAWMAIMTKEMTGAWPTKASEYDRVSALIRANLKPRLAAVTTNTATTRAGFTNSHAGLAVWTDSQVATFVKETGLPLGFVFPKEGAPMISTTAMVTRTKNKYWAEQLIGYMLRPDAQLGFAKRGFYAPSNKTVKLDPEIASMMTYGESQVARLMDLPWDKITPINGDISEKFYEAIN